MRHMLLSIAFAAVVVMTGCGPTLSLNPLYTDKDVVPDPPLEGKWTDDDAKEVWSVSKSGNGYEAFELGKADAEKYEIHVVRLEQLRFLDITAKDAPSLSIPGHLIAKVWTEGELLRVQAMATDWFKQKIQETSFPHVMVQDKQLLLTAPTPQLQKLILLYANEPKAFDSDVGKLHRVR